MTTLPTPPPQQMKRGPQNPAASSRILPTHHYGTLAAMLSTLTRRIPPSSRHFPTKQMFDRVERDRRIALFLLYSLSLDQQQKQLN